MIQREDDECRAGKWHRSRGEEDWSGRGGMSRKWSLSVRDERWGAQPASAFGNPVACDAFSEPWNEAVCACAHVRVCV